MGMTIYTANVRGNAGNAIYETAREIKTLEDLKTAVKYDHIAPQMKESHRSKDNFISADCIQLDLDNTHSDDAEDWKSLADIEETFEDVKFSYVHSRNYMKPKEKTNKKTGVTHIQEPREKFHLYFPLSRTFTNKEEYESLMLKAAGLFPFFDLSAAKPAQFFFGVENPTAGLIEGARFLDEYMNGVEPQTILDSVNSFVAHVQAGDYQYANEDQRKETDKAITRLYNALGIARSSAADPTEINSDHVPGYNGLGLQIAKEEQTSRVKWFEEFAKQHDIEMGKRYTLPPTDNNHPLAIVICVPCAWEDEHSMTGAENESVVIIDLGGRIGYLCRHNACAGRGWKEYKAFYENRDAGNINRDSQQETEFSILPRKLEEIEEKQVDWLVPGYIPLGGVTLMAADGGAGKTSAESALAAALSSGSYPFMLGIPVLSQRNKKYPCINILFLSGEDFAEYTLREKIRKAGGDLNRIFVVDPSSPYIKKYCFNMPYLEKAIMEIKPRLVIIDPLQSFLPEDVNMAARNQMRQALVPVAKLADKYHLAILIAVHSNKRDAASGRNRVSDSSDIWDMARSVLMVGMTGEGDTRYISHEKSNWGVPCQTVIFRIIEGGQVQFLRYENKKDADYQNNKRTQRASERDAPKREDAELFILALLKEADENKLSAGNMKKLAGDEGISAATLRAAREALTTSGKIKKVVESRGKGKGTEHYYQLVECDADPAALDINNLELEDNEVN